MRPEGVRGSFTTGGGGRISGGPAAPHTCGFLWGQDVDVAGGVPRLAHLQ
jgi:hypothetical protein